MKNWYVGVEQKTKKSGDSKRTKKRDEKNLELGIVKKKVKKKNSLQSCVDYLLSKKHENHVHTQINEIGNARQDLNNILDEVGSVRLKNAATSFCASIPADLYHPSLNEWEKIYHLTMENYCNSLNEELERLEKEHHQKPIPKSERLKKEYHLNTDRYAQRLDIEEMKRLSICVIHDDRNKPLVIGETSGSQMNLLISNVIDNKVVKLISQKNGVELFKKSYVQAVKNELGIDPKNYLTYEERLNGKEHKDFYSGPSNVELLKIESSTPRKKIKDQELRLKDDKKSHYQATNEKLDSLVFRETEVNKKINKNLKIVKAGRIEKTALETTRTEVKKEIEQNKIAKNEIKEFFKNILDDDFLKNFWTGIFDRCKRNKFTHKQTLDVYETEKAYTHELQEKLLKNLEMIEPGAKQKHKEEQEKKAQEHAEKVAKRHELNEFKTKQQLEDEKFKKQQNQQKIKQPKAKDPEEKESIWKRWGLVN